MVEYVEPEIQTSFKTSANITEVVKSMISAAKEFPEFKKSSGSYLGKYVKLETIIGNINPILLKYNLLLIQSPGPLTKGIKLQSDTVQYSISVITRVQHISGEYFESTCGMPLPTGKQTNISQEAGIAITYARRYAVCAIFNINVHGDDYDGAKPKEKNTPPVSKKHQNDTGWTTENHAISCILTLLEADQKGDKKLPQEYHDKWIPRLRANNPPSQGWIEFGKELEKHLRSNNGH